MTFARPKGSTVPTPAQVSLRAERTEVELTAYGTPQGVIKSWLKRQRGRFKRRPKADYYTKRRMARAQLLRTMRKSSRADYRRLRREKFSKYK